MRVLRFMRFMLLALFIAAIPASSYAGVFISVGFAPPVLPVYEQPPCPEPGWMWIPGYWAYGDDGYYWVPGTWVPAPYEGALWTPGYWGWGGGLYAWHPGYWGRHVGYYGGVNYGFGYMGVGFAGGLWVGGAFRYNTAVMRVGPGIHNTYIDRTIVHNTTIVNDRRVAYSGGAGGINHAPTAEENRFSHEQHQSASSYQSQHETAARGNVSNYASHNGGHPSNLAVARPMSGGGHAAIGSQSSGSGAGKVTMNNREPGHTAIGSQSNGAGAGKVTMNNGVQTHTNGNPQYRNSNGPQFRNNDQASPRFNGAQQQARTQPQMRTQPQPQVRTQPQSRPMPQERPAPQMHGGPPAGGQPHGGGGGQPHNEGSGHEHGH